MLLVLKSVAQSVAAMTNVSLLLFLAFIMFGAMGMHPCLLHLSFWDLRECCMTNSIWTHFRLLPPGLNRALPVLRVFKRTLSFQDISLVLQECNCSLGGFTGTNLVSRGCRWKHHTLSSDGASESCGITLFCRCTDNGVASQDECIGTFIDAGGQLVLREWRNSDLNFDNILQAFISLFVVISMDGYSDLMLRCMSIPSEKNLQPKVCSGENGQGARVAETSCATVAGGLCTWDCVSLPLQQRGQLN